MAGQSVPGQRLEDVAAARSRPAERLRPRQALAAGADPGHARRGRHRLELPGSLHDDRAHPGAGTARTASSPTSRPRCFADRLRREASGDLAAQVRRAISPHHRRAIPRPTKSRGDVAFVEKLIVESRLDRQTALDAVLPMALNANASSISIDRMGAHSHGSRTTNSPATVTVRSGRGSFCGRTRREFLWEIGGGFGSVALTALLGREGF